LLYPGGPKLRTSRSARVPVFPSRVLVQRQRKQISMKSKPRVNFAPEQTRLSSSSSWIGRVFQQVPCIVICLGFARAPSRVACNDRPLHVTPNLYDVLEELRRNRVNARWWIDAICMYPDRYRTKCCRNLRFEPQFCEGFGFAHLAYWVSWAITGIHSVTWSPRPLATFMSLSSVDTHKLCLGSLELVRYPLQSGARLGSRATP
jgi:hypothetical protein